MERLTNGNFATRFEDLLPDIARLIDEDPTGIFIVKIRRFGGELFGTLNVSGKKEGNIFRLKIDNVQPLALGSFFLGIAQANGEVQPGGIYLINYEVGTAPRRGDQEGKLRGGLVW